MPASIFSNAESLGGMARRLLSQPKLEVLLDGHSQGKIYTTLDAISGHVELTAPHNARFDDIRITFEGSIETWIENLSPASTRSRTTAVHNFLRLTMPIRDSDYPQPRVAEAGRTYKFPFNFVVPEQLLPRSCTHECVGDYVHEAHLCLPPSMGDYKSFTGKDDLGPSMTKVRYAVKARVLRLEENSENSENSRKEKQVVVENLQMLHVVPAQPEAPPLSIDPKDSYHCLSKTKTLRKGVFSGRLGKITVSAAQTGALMLPAPSEGSTTPAETVATLKLRFDPHDESSKPPKLGGLTTKIKTSTFFSVKPHRDWVDRRGTHIDFDVSRGVYETSMVINARSMEAVTWTKQTGNFKRKNSASSTSSSDYSDTNNAPEPEGRGPFYTATILVPISLPATKTWITSFQSCIASRTYLLDLSLGVHALGTGVPSSSITLHLPVQIGAQGSGAQRTVLTPLEAAAELADAEEFLRPRVIEVPSQELVGNSVLSGVSELPPSYEDYVSPVRYIVSPGRG